MGIRSNVIGGVKSLEEKVYPGRSLRTFVSAIHFKRCQSDWGCEESRRESIAGSKSSYLRLCPQFILNVVKDRQGHVDEDGGHSFHRGGRTFGKEKREG